eukprot:TCONS_00022828-protein
MENCCSNEMNHCYCNHINAKRTSIKHIWMFWLVFISLISGTLCDGGTEIQGVQASGNMFNEITMENFDQITKDKDIMLILFYMPWCGHCKALQPEWEKASKVLEDNREYVLGRSNCDGSGKPLCQKVNVEMYPDIRLYRHGKYIESYEGDRKAESILEFVQRAQSTTGRVGSSPPLADLSTTPQPAAQQFAPPEQSATIPQTQNTASFQQQQSQGGQTNTLPQVQQQQQQQLQMSFAPPQQQLTFPTMQQVPAMQQFQTPIQTPNGLGAQLDLFTTVPNSDVMGRAGGIEPQQQPFIANGQTSHVQQTSQTIQQTTSSSQQTTQPFHQQQTNSQQNFQQSPPKQLVNEKQVLYNKMKYTLGMQPLTTTTQSGRADGLEHIVLGNLDKSISGPSLGKMLLPKTDNSPKRSSVTPDKKITPQVYNTQTTNFEKQLTNYFRVNNSANNQEDTRPGELNQNINQDQNYRPDSEYINAFTNDLGDISRTGFYDPSNVYFDQRPGSAFYTEPYLNPYEKQKDMTQRIPTEFSDVPYDKRDYVQHGAVPLKRVTAVLDNKQGGTRPGSDMKADTRNAEFTRMRYPSPRKFGWNYFKDQKVEDEEREKERQKIERQKALDDKQWGLFYPKPSPWKMKNGTVIQTFEKPKPQQAIKVKVEQDQKGQFIMKFNGPMLQNTKVIIAPNAQNGQKNIKSGFEDALSNENSDDSQNILQKPDNKQIKLSANPKSQTKFKHERQPLQQLNQNQPQGSKQVKQDIMNSQRSSDNEGAVGPSQVEASYGRLDAGIIQNPDKITDESQQLQFGVAGSELINKHFTPEQNEMATSTPNFNEASSLQQLNGINDQAHNNGQNEISSAFHEDQKISGYPENQPNEATTRGPVVSSYKDNRQLGQISEDFLKSGKEKTVSIKVPANVPLSTVLKNIYQHMYKQYFNKRPDQGGSLDAKKLIDGLVQKDMTNLPSIMEESAKKAATKPINSDAQKVEDFLQKMYQRQVKVAHDMQLQHNKAATHARTQTPNAQFSQQASMTGNPSNQQTFTGKLPQTGNRYPQEFSTFQHQQIMNEEQQPSATQLRSDQQTIRTQQPRKFQQSVKTASQSLLSNQPGYPQQQPLEKPQQQSFNNQQLQNFDTKTFQSEDQSSLATPGKTVNINLQVPPVYVSSLRQPESITFDQRDAESFRISPQTDSPQSIIGAESQAALVRNQLAGHQAQPITPLGKNSIPWSNRNQNLDSPNRLIASQSQAALVNNQQVRHQGQQSKDFIALKVQNQKLIQPPNMQQTNMKLGGVDTSKKSIGQANWHQQQNLQIQKNRQMMKVNVGNPQLPMKQKADQNYIKNQQVVPGKRTSNQPNEKFSGSGKLVKSDHEPIEHFFERLDDYKTKHESREFNALANQMMNIPLRVISQEHKENTKKSIVTSGPSIINDENSDQSSNKKKLSTKKTISRPIGTSENTKKSIVASGPSIMNNLKVKEVTHGKAVNTQSTISRPEWEPQKKENIPAPNFGNSYPQYQFYNQPQNQYFTGYKQQTTQNPYMQNYWTMNRLGNPVIQNTGFTRSYINNGFGNFQYLTSPVTTGNEIKKELTYEFHQKKDSTKFPTDLKSKPLKDVPGTKKGIIESNDVMASLAYPTKGSVAQQTDSKAVFENDPFENTKRNQIARVQQRLMLLRRKRKSVDDYSKKLSVKESSFNENEKSVAGKKRRKISVVSQSSVIVTKGAVKRKTQKTSTASRKRNTTIGTKKLTNERTSLKEPTNQKPAIAKSNIGSRKDNVKEKNASENQAQKKDVLFKKSRTSMKSRSVRSQKTTFNVPPITTKRKYTPTVSPTKRSKVPQPKPSATIQPKPKLLTNEMNNANAWSLNSTFLDALNKGVPTKTRKRFSVNKVLKDVGKNTRKSQITRRHKQPKLKHKEKKRKTIEKEHENLTKGIMQNALNASFIQPTQAASQTVMMSSVDRLLGNNTILSEPRLDANSSLVDHETLASSPLKEETGSSRSNIAAIGESAFNSALDQPKLLSFSDEAMGEKTRGTDFGVNDVEESLMKSMEIKDELDGGDKKKRKKSEIVVLHYGDNIRDKKSEIAKVFKKALEKEGDIVQNFLEIKNVKKSVISRPLNVKEIKNNKKSIISQPRHTGKRNGTKKFDISQNQERKIMDSKKLNFPNSVKMSANSENLKKTTVPGEMVKSPKGISKKYNTGSPKTQQKSVVKAKKSTFAKREDAMKSFNSNPDDLIKVNTSRKSTTPRVQKSTEPAKKLVPIKKTLKVNKNAFGVGTQLKNIAEIKKNNIFSKIMEIKNSKRSLNKKTKEKSKGQESSSNENIMEIQ